MYGCCDNVKLPMASPEARGQAEASPGLPWEVWQLVFSQLSTADLGPACCVCRAWNSIVQSLDTSRWRELYRQSSEWKSPYWPLKPDVRPPSWKEALRERTLSTRFWYHGNRTVDETQCLGAFWRNRGSFCRRKTIIVGKEMEHDSLKSALAVANDYDRIQVNPGIYDEQFEMSSKLPLELVGAGVLGSVILVMCVEQTAITGRLCNLVLRAPWFTSFALKVKAGYIQVDNCIIEDGLVLIQNPGSCHFNFCTFRHANVILEHVNSSLLENCEFSQCDLAAVSVEGFPKDEVNWSHSHLMQLSAVTKETVCKTNQKECESTSSFSLKTRSSLIGGDNNGRKSPVFLSQRQLASDDKGSVTSSVIVRNVNNWLIENSADCGSQLSLEDLSDEVQVPNKSHASTGTCKTGIALADNSGVNSDPGWCRTNGLLVDTLLGSAQHSENLNEDEPVVFVDFNSERPGTSYSSTNGKGNHDVNNANYKDGDMSVNSHSSLSSKSLKTQSTRNPLHRTRHIDSSMQKDINGATLSPIKGDQDTCNTSSDASYANSSVSAGADFIEVQNLQDLTGPSTSGYECSSSGHDERRVSTQAWVQSHNDKEVGPDTPRHQPEQSPNASRALYHEEVHGEPLLLVNEMSSEEDSSDLDESSSDSSSNVEFSRSETSLSDPELAYIPYSERRMETGQDDPPVLSEQLSVVDNEVKATDILEGLWEDSKVVHAIGEIQGVMIRNCRMNNGKGGVMVSCQGHATIIGCQISNMGYGIRCVQNSRVVVLRNEIRHCRTSGIFMRLAASGVIAANDIHSNLEAGIDVRKNADPIIQGNQIHHGERFGIAVLCSGQGLIRNNDIYANADAGVYILYRGNPLISENRLIKNQAAGVSVNENGLGVIKDNTISGNVWAGVYVRHGGDPLVQNNLICKGVADGVVIGEKGRGTISKNTITGNAGCGVWIMGGECPLLHGNNIDHNGDSGIAFVTDTNIQSAQSAHAHKPANLISPEQFVSEERRETKPHYSQSKVVNNTVCHNAGHGISVESGKDVLLGSNSIHGNNKSGVYINHPGKVTVCNNNITRNQDSGVTTSSLGQVSVLGNGVYDNRRDGIICQNEATITENDLSCGQNHCISLKGSKNVKVYGNRMCSTKAAISLNEEAHGIHVIHRNQIYSGLDHPIGNTSHIISVTDNEMKMYEGIDGAGLPWQHSDPAPRPLTLDQEDPVIHTPARYVRSVARVTVLEPGQCHGGSKTCVVL